MMSETKWTQFMDMHSGGGTKEEPYQNIYIEAPEGESRVIFYNRFGHSPDRVTCTCCGEDYSLTESESLEQATAYHRNCDYDNDAKCYVERPRTYSFYPANSPSQPKLISLNDYANHNDVLIIYAKDIKPSERVGDVPEQGYVWMD